MQSDDPGEKSPGISTGGIYPRSLTSSSDSLHKTIYAIKESWTVVCDLRVGDYERSMYTQITKILM